MNKTTKLNACPVCAHPVLFKEDSSQWECTFCKTAGVGVAYQGTLPEFTANMKAMVEEASGVVTSHIPSSIKTAMGMAAVMAEAQLGKFKAGCSKITENVKSKYDPDAGMAERIVAREIKRAKDRLAEQGIGAVKEEVSPTTTKEILQQRGNRYGLFKGHAEITQSLKTVMHETNNWQHLDPAMQESLEMIAHKIGRILNGDPYYDDSWIDIAGYSQLIVNILHKKEQ